MVRGNHTVLSGKKYQFQKGRRGGINICFRPKYRPLIKLWENQTFDIGLSIVRSIAVGLTKIYRIDQGKFYSLCCLVGLFHEFSAVLKSFLVIFANVREMLASILFLASLLLLASLLATTVDGITTVAGLPSAVYVCDIPVVSAAIHTLDSRTIQTTAIRLLFFLLKTIGISDIGLTSSINYRTFGYRIKASVYQILNSQPTVRCPAL